MAVNFLKVFVLISMLHAVYTVNVTVTSLGVTSISSNTLMLYTTEPLGCVFNSYDPYIFMLCENVSYLYSSDEAQTQCNLSGYQIAGLQTDDPTVANTSRYFLLI
jgi:hypothetical protein